MASLSTMTRYLSQRLDFSINFIWTGYKTGKVTERQVWPLFMKCLFKGSMTYYKHLKVGVVMAPMATGSDTTLLFRKLNVTGPNKRIFVGDVVTFRNPVNRKNYMVGRVAATEGCEMVSNDKTDEPFVLPKDQFWVLAHNENVKPEEANDSRTFGPILIESIAGRAIYCVRSAADHGIVQNSESSMQIDSPVLEVELDVDKLVELHKENTAKMKNEGS